MTSAVVLALSIALLLLLLIAFFATRQRDRRKPPLPTAPGPPDPPAPDTPAPPLAAPTGRAGQVGTDYFDPRTIKVGDTIDCQGIRARVPGAMHLSWQGRQWTELLLDDGTPRSQWLSIEVRPGLLEADPPHLEVLLWTSVPTQGMIPAKSTLVMEGVEFSPADRGTIAFKSEGRTGYPDRGLLDFADYRAADGRLLSFDRVQGEAWAAAYAEPLPPGSIERV
ncbi:DUF4178 domain-containing protein [Sinosporangium siamense]|uniref:DUF4178 domain-containing protein n=1 Tax=Sinosporangium siamense TaxID=1367973 RepID=A0A919RFU6_9ACTN|nr:DUF4178 domain-containing protein [Sinosporangium siamense]GII93103.1 hypothetical protein Ssi02_33340 [Sinosporangium siamense]